MTLIMTSSITERWPCNGRKTASWYFNVTAYKFLCRVGGGRTTIILPNIFYSLLSSKNLSFKYDWDSLGTGFHTILLYMKYIKLVIVTQNLDIRLPTFKDYELSQLSNFMVNESWHARGNDCETYYSYLQCKAI